MRTLAIFLLFVYSAMAAETGKGVNFYSIEKEIALGRQLAIEVEKQAKIVDDPMISEYVNRLGQNLARHSDVRFPMTFKLIESDEINAFTLPGGYIFVSSGLFKLSDNEAELASAISHELGHSAARHATRLASRNQIFDLSTLPLAILGGPVGFIARQVSAFAVPATMFKFSREFETEADLLGLETLWKSGYDPNASVDLFERVESTEQRQPGIVSRLFRSHPLTPDRLKITQQNIDKRLADRQEYILNTSEYECVRERLTTLPAHKKPDSDDPSRPTLMKRQTE